MIKYFSNIYDYIEQQENEFKSPISVYDTWEWNWLSHLKTSVFYKFGRLLTGNSEDKPVKNIVRPILNVAYRAEDIDVKDVNIYVNDEDKYHLSFLVKKYHDEVFAKDNNLDTFFDEVKEEKIDFGGSLVEKADGARPKMIPLQTIAFCDQSDIMGSPFGIKMSMNASELLDMAKRGWGNPENGANISMEELVDMAQFTKNTDDDNEQTNKTPGKYVDIYKVWGMLPKRFLEEDAKGYSLQMHYVTFMSDGNGGKTNLTLFAKEDKDKDRFKFVNRDKVEGRALGYGAVEELFEAQVWTNYSMIAKKEMLDAASKIVLQTTDPNVVSRHPSGLKDLDNLEIIELEEGKTIGQVDNFPRNYQAFSSWVDEFQQYAQVTGSASDPVLGEEPKSGTPFRLQERVVQEGKGLHEYRREKYAHFIEEVYKDWIIPHIATQITKETSFLASLSSDELEFVANNIAVKEANKFFKDEVLKGNVVQPEDFEEVRALSKERFLKGGNKKFLKILEGELKQKPLKVFVDVAGKSKDLSSTVDKLTNVFRQIFANPAILQDERAAKVFNKILEYSGLSQIDFSGTPASPAQPQAQTPAQAVAEQPSA